MTSEMQPFLLLAITQLSPLYHVHISTRRENKSSMTDTVKMYERKGHPTRVCSKVKEITSTCS